MKLGVVRLVATSLAVATVVLLLVLSPGEPERRPVAKPVDPAGFDDLLRSSSLGLVGRGSLGDLFATSCGVVRLNRHEHVSQPFTGCLASAIKQSRSAELTIIRHVAGSTTTTAYRSVAGQTGLLLGRGTDGGWILRDCPDAKGVRELRVCTRVSLAP
jgi:hypothetical protein